VFNERVRLDGAAAADCTLCSAFSAVESARGPIPLTYFEFSALAALHCFREAAVDVAVLEVGLGGRLDAFNLVSADVSVITSIGLDHQAYLGEDLEGIGREKAGVMRPGQRVVLGADVTRSVEEAARRLGCSRTRLGADFHARQHAPTWDFVGRQRRLEGLPLGSLAAANCALAIEAAGYLAALPADRVGPALAAVSLPGRMESWPVGAFRLLLDVAHNPSGARFLGEQLAERYPGRRFVAVLGMLEDKDCAGVAAALAGQVRAWVCVPTRGPRGQSGVALTARIAPTVDGRGACVAVIDVAQALDRALSLCEPGDGILAFGSFDLVEQMRDALLSGRAGAEAPASSDALMGPHR
jgi:dihydrofolate synthase/folylpolyglutamate synthase